MAKHKLADHPTQEELFNRSRNNALFSFREDKIRAFCYRWGITCPKNKRVFWMGVYKAILKIPEAPDNVCAEASRRLNKLMKEVYDSE